MEDPLAAIRSKPTKRIIGLISGTSADGIAAALVRVQDHPGRAPGIGLLGATTVPYPPEVRRRVLTLFTEAATMQEAASLHYLLGDLFADAALVAAAAARVAVETVDLIASHGQTVAHVPLADPGDRWSRPATLQLGEAAVIAERTGRPVIADFRANDIAAGGQAAPLVPYADLLLFGGPTGRIALNLGGISNLTVLPAGGTREDVYAFDCGPGNMIMDGLVRHFFGDAESFDRDGAHAARGTVRADVLTSLLDHPFIGAPPPKTAGHEQFGRGFLLRQLERWGAIPPDDLLATAAAFTVEAVARNIGRFVLPHDAVEELVVSGGGVHNPVVMRRLEAAMAPIRVRRIDEFGVPADAKEALAFALLGHASVMGFAGNLPRVTGARHAAVLGKFTWPPLTAGRTTAS